MSIIAGIMSDGDISVAFEVAYREEAVGNHLTCR
jgi:hypothetical protein